MAYIKTEQIKAIRKELKERFPDIKFSVTNEHFSTAKVAIITSEYDFSSLLNEEGYNDINTYYPENYKEFSGLFKSIINVIKGNGWDEDFDSSKEYLEVGYYCSLSIGKWNKPYEMKEFKKVA